MSKRLYYALAVLILLLAATLRFWNLTTLPAGLSNVEISHINVVDDEVQQGRIRVFYEREIFTSDEVVAVGQEGLYHLILGAVAVPFGMGTFSLRVLSVLLGMITLTLLYTLGVRLFGYFAGLVSLAYFAVLMYPILLSRLVIVEAVIPLIVTAVLLTLARAFPVYYRTRAESTNTLDFALMGIVISMSFYIHENSLFIVLMAMAFITYMMLTQRQISTRRVSYIGFGMLMFFIIAMPYGLSTLRLPELSANTRILGDYNSITLSIVESILGIFWQGDSNILINLPQRPMMDIVSGILLIIGFIFSVLKWRNPRYAIVLIAIIFLAPPAIFGDNSPNFLELALLIPVIALLIGIGASQIVSLLPQTFRGLAIGVIVVLWAGNLIWTVDSLFNEWRTLPATQRAYNQPIGDIALHFDQTGDDIPIVICNPEWDQPRANNDNYNDVELIKLHMNNDSLHLREIDCRKAFIFVNAGQHQQVLLLDSMRPDEILPLVADWLSLATPLEAFDGAVLDMQIQSDLEDSLGVFTTTTPASYATETDLSARVPIAPPIRFGGNITWLGYEIDPIPEYTANSIVPVSTYWRIEGLVPSDLLVFTHLLSDPLFPAAQLDTIHIDPAELRERDVYLHNADIALSPTIEAGDYFVSVGVYQESSRERLPVFINASATQGNRIFLYPVSISETDAIGN